MFVTSASSPRQVQAIVNHYKESNKLISEKCMSLAESWLINVDTNRVYTFEELQQSQADHRRVAAGTLVTAIRGGMAQNHARNWCLSCLLSERYLLFPRWREYACGLRKIIKGNVWLCFRKSVVDLLRNAQSEIMEILTDVFEHFKNDSQAVSYSALSRVKIGTANSG